ncbi:MAG: hydroxymethylpyrimidine/phosphomethylpyrimidine kinase [Zetaproteobacteria bacterium]|nr:hydroxymethylpyrimidine/phosphomethylpyrimidine kinase [Zetaproteobacteria bacterium]
MGEPFNQEKRTPVCLTIGGSDSCAGAGIQADLRVMHALGVHGCSAITALTAQSYRQIDHIEYVSTIHLHHEITTIFRDYDVRSVKTGMLAHAAHVEMIAKVMQEQALLPWVIDPVMISSTGQPLLDVLGKQEAASKLFPHASLVTPNIPEAEYFLEHRIREPRQAAQKLADHWNTPVLLKGGHNLSTLIDTLAMPGSMTHQWSHPPLQLNHAAAHGTGCRLASAIAVYLSQAYPLVEAVNLGMIWLQQDLRTSLQQQQDDPLH